MQSKIILSDNELELETITLELKYFGMLCDCPQWATPENIVLYESLVGGENEMPMDSLFMNIVPQKNCTLSPFDLEYNSLDPVFLFTGSFFKDKVKWTSEDGMKYNVKVFEYSKCVAKH
jgi:hypothetical protein